MVASMIAAVCPWMVMATLMSPPFDVSSMHHAPKVPPIPPAGPAFGGPANKLSHQDVARNSAPTLGDKPGNDPVSPSVDPSAIEYSESLKRPDPALHARQPDPRQHIFEALCDDPSLTREDALALLAIRDEALAKDAVTQIWPRQRIIECVRQPDAARELMQRSPLHNPTGKDSIQANNSSSMNALPRSHASLSTSLSSTSMPSPVRKEVARDPSAKASQNAGQMDLVGNDTNKISTMSVPPHSSTSLSTPLRSTPTSASVQKAATGVSSAKAFSVVGSKDVHLGNATLPISINPNVLTPTSSPSFLPLSLETSHVASDEALTSKKIEEDRQACLRPQGSKDQVALPHGEHAAPQDQRSWVIWDSPPSRSGAKRRTCASS